FVIFYSAVLLALEWLAKKPKALSAVGAAQALPFGIGATSDAYHQVAVSHSYHYLIHWEWYEWLGAVGPLFIFWWFSGVARARSWRNVELMSRAVIIFGAINIAGALVLSLPVFESLARIQPMRGFYLVYVLLVLFGGGFLGEFVLKNRAWRWGALF